MVIFLQPVATRMFLRSARPQLSPPAKSLPMIKNIGGVPIQPKHRLSCYCGVVVLEPWWQRCLRTTASTIQPIGLFELMSSTLIEISHAPANISS